MSNNVTQNQVINSSTYEFNDKDSIINQLKSQIFDLEQNAKDYNSLKIKCKQIANEASILNEEKIRLEYELKQKTQNSNKIICELQSDKENLQNALNEKLVTNKTLFSDNNNLFATLESKNQEVENLKEALAERDEIISQIQEEKHNLEMTLNDYENTKKNAEINIQKLNNDIEHLKSICLEQENSLKKLTEEKRKLLDQLGTINFDNKNLAQKLKSTTENLNASAKQLNEANKTILRLDEDLNQTENELTKAKNDINFLSNALGNEKRAHEEFKEKADRLESTLKEKMNDIKNMNNEIINLNGDMEKLNQEKNRTDNDIEKYKSHIMFLTETNQKLINELEIVNDRNQQLKQILSEGDGISDFLKQTRDDIDSALNTLEIGLTTQK